MGAVMHVRHREKEGEQIGKMSYFFVVCLCVHPYDAHKHTQSPTQACKTTESGYREGAQRSSVTRKSLRGLSDPTQPVSSRSSIGTEICTSWSPILLRPSLAYAVPPSSAAKGCLAHDNSV